MTRQIMNVFGHKLQIKSFLCIVFFSGVIVGKYLTSLENTDNTATIVPDSIEVCFSLDTNCNARIINTISTAQTTIFVQSYIFTSSSIADALIKAYQRGIKIIILIDRSQKDKKNTQVYKLLKQGIPVLVDHVPGIAHNKIMIIDDTYVITGSFNWTNAAAHRNAENLIIINNKKLNQIYRTNFEKRVRTAIQLVEQTHNLPKLSSFDALKFKFEPLISLSSRLELPKI